MKLLHRFDDAIAARATQAAHALQRATGLTSLFIARMGLLMSACALTVVVVNHYRPLLVHAHDDVIEVVMSFAMGAFLIVPVYEMLKRVDHHTNVVSKRVMLAREIAAPIFWRLGMATLGSMELVDAVFRWQTEHFPILYVIHNLDAVGFAIFAYFVRVDPLPPCRGWMFERVRSWFIVSVPESL